MSGPRRAGMPRRPRAERLEWPVNGAPDTGPACSRLWARARADIGCGSHRDRHENIGAGQIGTAPFAALRHPATRGVPFVVETPGPRAAVAADIATLKALHGKGLAACAPAGAMR